MRVTVYGLNEGYAGFGHVLINLVNALADHPIDLDVVTHSDRPHDDAKLAPTVHRTVIGGAGAGRAYALARHLRRQPPDILLCDSNREKSNRILLSAMALAGSRARTVFRLGVSVSQTMAQRNPLNAFFYGLSIRYSFFRADRIVVNSLGVKEDLVKTAHVAREKIRRVPNSTVSPVLQTLAAEPTGNPWVDLSPEPVIVSAGRLRKIKDFETLLRAFHIVRQRRPCRLVILGEGGERQRLEELVAELALGEHVRLVGHQQNPFAYYRRADLFALSSRSEGSPNVLIEALALGVPVVSTDCPSGPREILQGGRYGSLVPVGDHEKLAEAMLATLADPLPPHALKEAVVDHRAERVAARYVAMFEEMLGQSGR